MHLSKPYYPCSAWCRLPSNFSPASGPCCHSEPVYDARNPALSPCAWTRSDHSSRSNSSIGIKPDPQSWTRQNPIHHESVGRSRAARSGFWIDYSRLYYRRRRLPVVGCRSRDCVTTAMRWVIGFTESSTPGSQSAESERRRRPPDHCDPNSPMHVASI